MSLLFVYGTLKTGECRATLLRGQIKRGNGKTLPKYRLFRLTGFPGLVESAENQGLEIEGEIWDVEPDCLNRLDEEEGTDAGLYERRLIELAPPFHDAQVEAYFYLQSIAGREDCGSRW